MIACAISSEQSKRELYRLSRVLECSFFHQKSLSEQQVSSGKNADKRSKSPNILTTS